MITTDQIEKESKHEEENVTSVSHQLKWQKMENSIGKDLAVNLL